jgi:hypothetical protein
LHLKPQPFSNSSSNLKVGRKKSINKCVMDEKACYAKDTLSQLDELKIDYVPKEENPSNVPQLDRKFLG